MSRLSERSVDPATGAQLNLCLCFYLTGVRSVIYNSLNRAVPFFKIDCAGSAFLNPSEIGFAFHGVNFRHFKL